jgi:HAE1 family hydrophobic/amphiphilic exporter-1
MSSYSVKKPISVLMGILIIIVLGLFSLTRLPLSLFPDVNLPFVVTVTSYPGASPEVLEKEVTSRIEAAVSTIGNFATVQSQSNENFAISFVTFQEGTNLDSVTVELREIVNNLNFPDRVGNTTILRLSPDLLPVMNVTLFKTYDASVSDEQALILNTEWINRDILNELKSVAGVADVTLIGAADIVLEVVLDNEALDTYGLTQAYVLEMINNQNASGLVGAAVDDGAIRLLYVGSAPDQLDAVKVLPIAYINNEIITLDMVSSSIAFANQAVSSYSKVNGAQGIQVQFQKQSDVGITEVTSRILDKLNALVAEDSTASYEVLFNQGEFITQSVNSVFSNLLIGGLLAVFVLLLFLRDIKPTIIVGLAIPISVIAAFLLMYISNISLNIISMGGLALGIGMLVDNAVVVIENIYRLLSEGKSKVEAAIYGAKEVAGAITASTITTAAVFLPIFFIEGLVADIFIPMALTIAYSLVASLVIALSLVPTMSAKFLSETSVKKETKMSLRFKSWYKTSVLFSINHKLITTAVIVLLLFGSSAIVFSRGFILLPATDEGTINVNISFTEDVTFETKTEFADKITLELLALQDIETISATVGGGFVFGPPTAQGSGAVLAFTVNLKQNRTNSTTDNAVFIEGIFEDFKFENVNALSKNQIIETSVSTQNASAGAFGPTGVSMKITGNDLLRLEQISNELVEIIKDIEGVEKPDNGIAIGDDRILISVNKEEAIKYGLSNQGVITNIELAFSLLANLGGTDDTTEVLLDGRAYPLQVPTNAIVGLSLDLFGDYINFLGGVQLFDAETLAFIQANHNEALHGPLYIPSFLLPDYVIGTPVQFILNPSIFVTTDDEGNMVSFTTPSMESRPLSSFAVTTLSDTSQTIVTMDKVTGFATIFTDGSSRFLEVTAQIADGFNVTLVSQQVVDAVETYLESDTFKAYGAGYNVSFEGENEEINELFLDLALGLIVAILIVYMVMAIQFQSLKYPLIILGTIPLAFTGGMLALLVTGSNLSLVALVGFVILVGIVVNNGIVLIDYINQLREKGLGVIESIVEAGQTRLRPIFMTAMTTILALFILALGIGQGAELLQPLAITAIGGLLYATFLTLLIVPMIYALFNRKAVKQEAQITNIQA